MQSPRRAFLGHLGLSLVGLLARMGLGGPRMPRERSIVLETGKPTRGEFRAVVEDLGSPVDLSKIPDGEIRQIAMTPEQARASWRDVRFVGFERPLIPPRRKLQ